MSDKPKDTIITISISPVANGKRKVLISGAPEMEMPVLRTGVFADVHHLFDEVWLELQKRAPQVVKVKALKSAAKKSDDTAVGETAPEESAGQGDAVVKEPEPDQAPDPVDQALDEAGANLEPEIPDPELPVIEGDTTDA